MVDNYAPATLDELCIDRLRDNEKSDWRWVHLLCHMASLCGWRVGSSLPDVIDFLVGSRSVGATLEYKDNRWRIVRPDGWTDEDWKHVTDVFDTERNKVVTALGMLPPPERKSVWSDLEPTQRAALESSQKTNPAVGRSISKSQR